MGRPAERYPDPAEFDEDLYRNLTILPCGATLNLQWIQTNITKEATSFCIPKNKVIRGMQANMFSLEVTSESNVSKYLVKRIVPKELPDKASEEIWIEFVLSVRTEIEFYADLLKPENSSIRNLFPRVYYSAGTSRELDKTPQETSFIIVMEDLSTDYFQTAMMNKDQARVVMESMAKLHAHFWKENLPAAERGGFWVLGRRLKFKEVETAEETWRQFLDRFPELQLEIGSSVNSVGTLIENKAEYLDNCVEKNVCTRIHGDAKGWNFFFGRESSENKFLFIDLQWTGTGNPLQDVAYALTTTLCAKELDSMDEYVDFYIMKLKEELSAKGLKCPDSLRSSFDDIWLDYARVIATGLWKNLNKETIEKNKIKVGPSMINRSWEHVLFITRRLVRLLK